MNKLNHYTHSGHCHPELLEKKDGLVVAQLRANLWKGDYTRINNLFLQVLKEPLKDGIRIMFEASVHFDPVYGLSLRIHDIDPSFSLGELEREKQESILLLKKEGIFDRNKSLVLPLLPQRIAIISVETSKGYADFLNVLDRSPKGYRFFHFLFPALLQGDRSASSIIEQLAKIKRVKHHFDAVVIVRGGGGDVGLASYNNFKLAETICTFPLPVLTGIGHSTNETVSEMVSFRSAITPTELADFFVRKLDEFATSVGKAGDAVNRQAKSILDTEKNNITHSSKFFISAASHFIESRHKEIESTTTNVIHMSSALCSREKWQLQSQIHSLLKSSATLAQGEFKLLMDQNLKLVRNSQLFFENQKQQIFVANNTVKNLDPVNVLRRGYSITITTNNKLVNSIQDVEPGTQMITMLKDGQINSTINFAEQIDTNE